MKTVLEKEKQGKYVGVPALAAAAERVLAELGLVQERGTVTEVPDERIPIRKIRELVAGRNERQLEKLLGTAYETKRGDSGAGVSTKKSGSEAMRYLESLLESPSAAASMTLGRRASGARNHYRRDVKRPQAAQRELAAPALVDNPAQENPAALEVEESKWERIEIEPGLELHIRSDYEAPGSVTKTQSLAERFRRLIRGRSGKS